MDLYTINLLFKGYLLKVEHEPIARFPQINLLLINEALAKLFLVFEKSSLSSFYPIVAANSR